MSDTDQFVRFLAAWALVHETADEGWKAAVARGETAEPGSMTGGAEAFVDGLSALVAAEKERLKMRLGEGPLGEAGSDDTLRVLEEVRFEVAELRGRVESMQASIDAIASRLSGRAAIE